MKRMKSNLDERQEQVLLHIEHTGCWMAFWGLLIVLIAEQFIYGFEFKTIAGEWIVFMVLAIYLSIACLRKGIWDRHLKPNFKTNIIASAVAALVFGTIIGVHSYFSYPGRIAGTIAAAAISAISVFVLCIIVLSLEAASLKKKQKLLEQEPDPMTED